MRQRTNIAGNNDGKNTQSIADNGKYSRSKHARGVALAGLLDENEGLHAVLCHQRGFFVGSSMGRILVFGQGQRAACATAAATVTAAAATTAMAKGNGWVPDAFSLTRVVQVCAADVVELQPGESTNPPWVRDIETDPGFPRSYACLASRLFVPEMSGLTLLPVIETHDPTQWPLRHIYSGHVSSLWPLSRYDRSHLR